MNNTMCLVESEEPERSSAGAIYKKNVSGEKPAEGDTVDPVVEAEMVKLNDTQPEPTEDANNVSFIICL